MESRRCFGTLSVRFLDGDQRVPVSRVRDAAKLSTVATSPTSPWTRSRPGATMPGMNRKQKVAVVVGAVVLISCGRRTPAESPADQSLAGPDDCEVVALVHNYQDDVCDRILSVLESEGIEWDINGSLNWCIAVPSASAARARELLAADPALAGHIIPLEPGKSISD